ncbi:hypothetical protein M2302_006543 [Micromonospora sp. A200]|uniref:hypothetical protein n=1 Tax=Micromonospora sp. A200 TaxID=2940568 RepID=UPI0024743B95|nr:hypothetical protein [Micromonospora sp. A200]MDH6466335.1 hypothetical protein [Micromonospora sp. A200]
MSDVVLEPATQELAEAAAQASAKNVKVPAQGVPGPTARDHRHPEAAAQQRSARLREELAINVLARLP